MNRSLVKKLMARVVSVACIAAAGNSLVLLAQGARPEKGAASGIRVAAPAKTAAANSPARPVATTKRIAGARRATAVTANVTVSGTVTDGSGAGWPLYARIEATSDSTEPVVVFTDPVTGAYSMDLPDGVDYTFVVTAVGPGYLPGGGPVTTDGPVEQDWALEIDAVECTAPGYSYPVGSLFETFSTDKVPPGWEVVNVSGSAHWKVTALGDPCGSFPGNNTGGSGPYALVNSQCFSDLETTDDTSLVTPSLDMSSLANAVIQWNTEFIQCSFCDRTQVGDVDISTDGGTTWTNVWEATGSDNIVGPSVQSADISGVAAGQANVKARFHYQSFWGGWWQVDNVLLGDPEATCQAQAGGLVVGNVSNANTGNGVDDATVTNLGNSSSTETFPTPEDPGQGNGFYTLFCPAGAQTLQAAKQFYVSEQETPTVALGGVVRQDFVLPAGQLNASPQPLSSFIKTNSIQDLTLDLTDTGAQDVAFHLFEVNIPPKPSLTQGFASPALRNQALARLPKDSKQRRTLSGAADAKGLAPVPRFSGPVKPKFPFAAGNILASGSTDLDQGWGVGFDKSADATWLTDIFTPDLYKFLSDATKTDATIDISSAITLWAADGTFNANTGMMWYVATTDGTAPACIFEVNPSTRKVTGNTICTEIDTSERGLAYDPTTDTYYMGSWLDATIYHFDPAGTILDSAYVGLGISGLAYYPKTGHLFVQVQDLDDNAISVLDAKSNYALVGSFHVSDGAFDDHGGAGMEADCDGHLWMVNQYTQTLYEVDSGEENFCSIDIPWLSESPTSGTVPGAAPVRPRNVAANPFPVTVTFNSAGLLPGLRQAQLKVETDTPDPVAPVPVNLTVLFNDVPVDSFAWNFAYGAAGAGIMHGCEYYLFCPGSLVTRAAMAGYIERAIHGSQTSPPVYLGEFQDVFFNDFNANYIQGLVDDGITAGCSVNPRLYCPDAPIPREQMAVFVLLGKHGSGWVPPACVTPIFDDVPCSNGFAPWVNALYNEGITAGCSTSPKLFCPDHDPSNPAPTNGWSTNAEMAVFLSVAFNLPHVP